MGRIVVIANSKSTRERSAGTWRRVERRLHDVFGDGADIRFTSESVDATRRARAALQDGAPWLAAAGGDGTVQEVVNAFFDAGGRAQYPDIPLSFIPCGTGNDWVRTLGLPSDPAGAVDALARPRDRRVDVGWARFRGLNGLDEERAFLNVAEAGVGARVVRRQKASLGRLDPRLGFMIGALLEGVRYARCPFRLVVDGEKEVETEPLLALIVAGGRYVGAGMHCAPMARLDDGLLEVIALGDVGWFDLIRNLRSFFRGGHLDHPKVRHRSARSIEVSARREVLLQLDGEVVGTLPLAIRVLPGALRVRY